MSFRSEKLKTVLGSELFEDIKRNAPFGLPISDPTISNYCSDECGFSLAQFYIDCAVEKKVIPTKRNTLKRKLENTLSDLRAGAQVPQPPAPWISDNHDVERLRRLRSKQQSVRRRVECLTKLARLIENAVERAELTRVGVGSKSKPADAEVPTNVVVTEVAVSSLADTKDTTENDGENTMHVDSSINDDTTPQLKPCGFDYRIVDAWAVPAGQDWYLHDSSEDNRAMAQDVFDTILAKERVPLEESGAQAYLPPLPSMCLTIGKCKSHDGWQTLRLEEVDKELDLAVEFFDEISRSSLQIIERLRKRRTST
ncbi:hypothetical protein HDU76_007114 [Blyttiomyces sp. JEL0837]|nr:hypothetical protein HDU76_007114 [Blyttiomyces sp. JEL0837]